MMFAGLRISRSVLTLLVITVFMVSIVCGPLFLEGQTLNVEIVVTGELAGRVDPKVYGQFIEHLGGCIYGGVWVGESSSIPNLRGFRLDVLDAVKAISPPVIRWPGGCFADGYHWKDGVGPRDKRPRRTNPAWGGLETNHFGTDEFIEFCRMVGAEPFIVVNVGSGTPQEAAEWVEYCNGDVNTTYGRLREEYGHPEPYNVKYWGIGNELYGEWEIGHMNETAYAHKVVEFAEAMRSIDPSIKIVAVGWFGTGSEQVSWNRRVLEAAGDCVDYLSLHTYCWKPPYNAYSNIMNYPLDVERDLKEAVKRINSMLKDKPGKEIKISLDEWGVWYANATGDLMQTVRLCDGLLAAGMFHVFHRLASNVTIATFAQMVNVLPAIVTDYRGDMYLTPIYLAFKLYRNNTGSIVLKTSTKGLSPTILDVSATMDEDGSHIYLAVINKDLTRSVSARIVLEDFKPKQACRLSQLNGPYIYSKNDFKNKDVVKITSSYVNLSLSERAFTHVFEPHSATILVLESESATSTPAPPYEETPSPSPSPASPQMPMVIGVGAAALLIILATIIVLKTWKPWIRRHPATPSSG